ncbi:hypothetical protein A3Q56_04802 [Intoshia linei]|uniref:PDZ domain-containing protein n=1 Tax=Intoshia linei TaxID=1819745 RepID=A0A177AZL8_9BILA|nr:hypothetical protein A3Q56_04802 [Intoshia linei]
MSMNMNKFKYITLTVKNAILPCLTTMKEKYNIQLIGYTMHFGCNKKTEIFKTKIIWNKSDPEFNNSFSFNATPYDGSRLLLCLYETKSNSFRNLVGCMSFGIRHLVKYLKNAKIENWFKLLPESAGYGKHQKIMVSEQGNHKCKNIDEYSLVDVKLSRFTKTQNFGICLSGNRPVYVKSIIPGLLANKADMRCGDILIEINGQNISRSCWRTVKKLISKENVINLKLQRKNSTLKCSIALDCFNTNEAEMNEYYVGKKHFKNYSISELHPKPHEILKCQIPSNLTTETLYQSKKPIDEKASTDSGIDAVHSEQNHKNINHNNSNTSYHPNSPNSIYDENKIVVNRNVLNMNTSDDITMNHHQNHFFLSDQYNNEIIHINRQYLNNMQNYLKFYSVPLRTFIFTDTYEYSVLFQNIEMITNQIESIIYIIDHERTNVVEAFLKKYTNLCNEIKKYTHGLEKSLLYLEHLKRNDNDIDVFIKIKEKTNISIEDILYYPLKNFINSRDLLKKLSIQNSQNNYLDMMEEFDITMLCINSLNASTIIKNSIVANGSSGFYSMDQNFTIVSSRSTMSLV